MAEELYRPIIKDGTHLANSKGNEGTYRGSLLNDETNQLEGQAEWEKVVVDDDEDNSNEAASAIAALIVAGVFTLGVIASPYIKKGWNNYIVPTTKKIWFKLTKKEPSNVPIKISDVPNCMKNFGVSLDNYLNALESECLSVELIDQLLSSIDELKDNVNDDNINISISLSQLTKIVNSISQSTELLAKEKNLDILDFDDFKTQSSDHLESLSNVLQIQKHILKAA